MRVVGIDHVQLAMPAGREVEAIAFYERLLGVPHVPKPPHLAARGGCWFERDRVKIHLGVDADFRPARKAHPALLVDDLPALVERLRAADVPIVEDQPLDGFERIYLDDPFGNRIELLEPVAHGGDEADTTGTSEVLAALLDERRLAVAGSIIDRARSVDEVVEHTGLDRHAVVHAIGTLRQVGLVETDGRVHVLPVHHLRALASRVGDEATPMDPVIGFGMTDAERAVLERFFSGRTLRQIPTDRPKRLIVLERIALEFDVGHRYRESELDDVLRPFHLDVAALRRHLVDEGLLSRTREAGETRYWRSGGRVTSIS